MRFIYLFTKTTQIRLELVHISMGSEISGSSCQKGKTDEMALEHARKFRGLSVFLERIRTPRVFGLCGSRDVDGNSRI